MASKLQSSNYSPIVGPFIKNRRQELGLTQNALGRKLGYVYGNYVSMLETGRAIFPFESWESYAEALEVSKPAFLRLVIEEKFPTLFRYLLC